MFLPRVTLLYSVGAVRPAPVVDQSASCLRFVTGDLPITIMLNPHRRVRVPPFWFEGHYGPAQGHAKWALQGDGAG